MIDPCLLDPSDDLLAGVEWDMTVTEASAWATPADCSPDANWHPAKVPGTAAGALADAGLFSLDAPVPLHDRDVWYLAHVEVPGPGAYRLIAPGLATVCEAWFDGQPVLISDSMYARHELRLDLDGPGDLMLCFRALSPHLDRKGPRARWRTQLADHPGLRLMRTTLLGHMPGWCPQVDAVGPWRGLHLVSENSVRIEDLRIEATLGEDGTGRLTVSLRLPGETGDTPPVLHCAGWDAPLDKGDGGVWSTDMLLPGIEAWWPHTHGTPHLHALTLHTAAGEIALGRTGFRRIEVDRGADGAGFALTINGVPVFCRGAVWTNADILRLPSTRESYRPWLERARDSHMNMLRIGGTMAPEAPAFHQLCDELGILVWQDLPFANFDYPAKDPDFIAAVGDETRNHLRATQASPSLAVVCGGSEMYQQAAMLGLPESRWRGPLTEEILPAAVQEIRPDVAYVPNSPCGGAMPFSPDAGIAHYYGVGAYLRPLEDARRADVRFAAECLAFSNVPDGEARDLPGGKAPGHDPAWKKGVPRDRGVGWDFEDVRDHYVETLYDVSPAKLRHGDPQAWLDLGRAAVAEVMEATYAEWRRPGSNCAGALVWTFQDLAPGAGWGVVARDGRPKSAWYGLKRVFRPVAVSLTDEGTNGLAIHLVNETAEEQALRLELTCLRDGRLAVASGASELVLAPREARTLAATDLIGAFFDVTYAFRFGPPSHDCVHVRLSDGDGTSLDEAFHFPLGRSEAARGAMLSVAMDRDDDGTDVLVLETDRVAQSVCIDDDAFEADDNWFHIAPGQAKRIRLVRRPGSDPTARPSGLVRALNCDAVAYSAA
jgi:beta-mannosidase